jgi:hypothetical protein
MDSPHSSDPAEMEKAHKYHREIHDLLDQLGTKLSRVSSNVDQEFLSAYRAHMLAVQSELRNLKQDVKKGEQLLNSDVQIARLEKEMKWFAGELVD